MPVIQEKEFQDLTTRMREAVADAPVYDVVEALFEVALERIRESGERGNREDAAYWRDVANILDDANDELAGLSRR